MTTQRTPIALIILDGFGYNQNPEHNAIAQANTPNFDALWKDNPHSLISGSGKCVGLPDNQMGNSEVGHITMGAGRTVYQDLTRIDLAIENGTFEQNAMLESAITTANKTGGAIHILGLLSPGGVHSHENQIAAMVKMAANKTAQPVHVHAFLDGRDTAPKSALASLEKLQSICDEFDNAGIRSIIGRYFAMDRDKRWERIQCAYDLITDAKANFKATSAVRGLQDAYDRGETDEFVQATAIYDQQQQLTQMQNGDAIIFMNFRADRARELTQTFIQPESTEIHRSRVIEPATFITLTEYDKNFDIPVAFPKQQLPNILAECISQAGLKQLRIAETEKYAHVTFFFNGGIEAPFANEDRILIPSPKVATYDLQPEMSAPEICRQLVNNIESKSYDLIICNFANPDMVGHTGNFDATVKAIEVIDQCLGQIKTALNSVNGQLILTADHGNAEKMYNNETNQPHTAHTSDPVPFIYYGKKAEIVKKDGKLSDIAPTLLYLMGLKIPQDMTGTPLIHLR